MSLPDIRGYFLSSESAVTRWLKYLLIPKEDSKRLLSSLNNHFFSFRFVNNGDVSRYGTHYLVRHDEPPAAEERKEEEKNLVKLNWSILLVHVTDTTGE